MRLYPAIDLMGGEVVRLEQGRAEDRTRYGDDPLAQAIAFCEAGATHLHVVDLDAAFGKGDNRAVIRRIVAESGLRVQTGGGLRDLDGIAATIDAGAWRVVIGSAALEDPSVVEAAVARFGDAVCVGLDAKNGRLKTRGWTQDNALGPVEAGRQMAALGVRTLVYTDIARDGMLGEPDVAGSVALAKATGCRVVVSGGVSRLEQLEAIAALDDAALIDGVISGKAIYEGRLPLAEALRALAAAPTP